MELELGRTPVSPEQGTAGRDARSARTASGHRAWATWPGNSSTRKTLTPCWQASCTPPWSWCRTRADASVSLISGRRTIDSRAASSELPRRVDALQSETGQGPCLDASYEERVVSVPDLSTDHRWPAFARPAFALGARSMLSFQLFVDGDHLGALNLFGHGGWRLRRRIGADRGAGGRPRRRRRRREPAGQPAHPGPGHPRPDRAGQGNPDGALTRSRPSRRSCCSRGQARS